MNTAHDASSDSSKSRSLLGASYVNTSAMTVEACVAFCSSGGFTISGVEFGSECYCDHALQDSATPASQGNCSMPCSGNSTELCGAANLIDVYWNGTPFPIVPQTVGSWQYKGCFSDNLTSRALPDFETISGGVTIKNCTSACKANGFGVAGLEFGIECCNNSPPPTSLLSDSECHTVCAGNTTEFCGGSNRLTVFEDADGEVCLSTTRPDNFNLAAVFFTPPTTGPTSVPLHVNIINTVTLVSWSILTVRAAETLQK
ncbi:WSC domain-containing protein [Mycena crocata]|nr:WSC domain-containing protein [Mycena crocata]